MAGLTRFAKSMVYDTAIRAGNLVHDATGLAEEGPLGMQSHLGQMQRQ